ncbi:MAG: hypothetical protein IJ093_03600 [Bacilli bacterium]|nr:hypothetical protein [Bacilli bacterium]
MEKLFVLAGKAGTGKDSIASIIKEKNSLKKVIIYPCTVYLKRYVSQIYGWGGSEEDKPRGILQNLGREIKEIYPDYFLKRMDEDIRFLSNYCDIMIITGIRLYSELVFLKEKYNGILIKVEKKELDKKLNDNEKNDITETDVDMFKEYDYIIDNDDNFDELYKKISSLLEEVK